MSQFLHYQDNSSDGPQKKKNTPFSKNQDNKPAQKKTLQKKSSNVSDKIQTGNGNNRKIGVGQDKATLGKKDITSNKQARTAQLKKQQDDIKQNKPAGMSPTTYLQLKDPAATNKKVAQAKFADYKKSQIKQLKHDKYAKTQFNSRVNQFERTLIQRKIDYGSDQFNVLVNEQFPGFNNQVQTSNNIEPVQKKGTAVQAKKGQSGSTTGTTGLPENIKKGIEILSGVGLDHIKVHKNSDKPGQINADAFTQDSNIYVAPGQEEHLAHEAWHVVQQIQGRVKPTMDLNGTPVNDDVGLEREADVIANTVTQMKMPDNLSTGEAHKNLNATVSAVQQKTMDQPTTNKPAISRAAPLIQRSARGEYRGRIAGGIIGGILGAIISGPLAPIGAILGAIGGVYLGGKIGDAVTGYAPGYAIVINTKPGYLPDDAASTADGTLAMLEGRMMNKRDARGKKKPSHRRMGHKKLADISPTGKLHIIAHGEPINDPVTQVPQNARSISGYSANEVADIIVDDNGLPDTFHGEIVMLVCHSGTKNDGQLSIAERLLASIRAKGPNPTSIKALLGPGSVDEISGRTVVTPDEDVGAYRRLRDMGDTLIALRQDFRTRPRREIITTLTQALRDTGPVRTDEDRDYILQQLRRQDNLGNRRAIERAQRLVDQARRHYFNKPKTPDAKTKYR